MRRHLFRAAALAAAAVALAAPGVAPAKAPSLYGAATHPLWASSSAADFDRELDLLADAGADTVRVDIGWSTLEQDAKGARAAWYVDKADTFFAHARARGLKAIVTLWSTPCWASSAPPEVKQECAGAWWERGVDRYPPADPRDFADAAAWVAARWGDDIAALEIWNEPNYDSFFKTPDPVSDYAALLRASYPRIKAAAPDVPVIGPAMVMSDAPFLEALYAKGIGGHYDGISTHPYNQGRDPRDAAEPPTGREYSFWLGVPWVREVMVAHGDADKKLWFTELGWSSCGPNGTSSWCVTPEVQARYLADAFRVIRERWDYVHAVSVYNLRNKGDSPTDRETQMGLVYRDFTPKPSYAAFADIVADMRAQPDLPPAALPLAPAVSAVPPVAVDRAAPAVRGLAVRPRAFLRGRRSSVRWRLSEPARVSFRIERRRRAARRWVGVRGSFVRAGGARANRIAFARARRLRPGRYRLVAVARDRAGNVSAPVRVAFRVLR